MCESGRALPPSLCLTSVFVLSLSICLTSVFVRSPSLPSLLIHKNTHHFLYCRYDAIAKSTRIYTHSHSLLYTNTQTQHHCPVSLSFCLRYKCLFFLSLFLLSLFLSLTHVSFFFASFFVFPIHTQITCSSAPHSLSPIYTKHTNVAPLCLLSLSHTQPHTKHKLLVYEAIATSA